ncbi:MAG: hypothetical protein KF686_03475 [Ramlibacter sp.]|nr:hypothetical protein [Ramlibacter sp.]
MGYTDLREIAGKVCGLHTFIFTTGLVVGLDDTGYEVRYCYEHHADAAQALAAWDGAGYPPGPWIKAKGPGIELLNPELTA